MADTFRYTLEKPGRLLFSSVTQKSAPRDVPNAQPKFSATVGIEELDFKKIVDIMVQAIKGELGSFSGNPNDYYLSCMGGKRAGERAIQSAQLKADGLRAKGNNDEAFKVIEKAEQRAALYAPFAGILVASSQFDVSLARLEGGKVIDIPDEEHARAQAGKDLFYSGAWIAPAVAFKGFRRKTLDAKDGCTAYLQNVLFVRKGERIGGAGGPSNNEVFGSKYAGYTPEDPTALAPGGASGGKSDFAVDDDVPF
jgi:hypothetical protein